MRYAIFRIQSPAALLALVAIVATALLAAWRSQGLPEDVSDTTTYAYRQVGGTLEFPKGGSVFEQELARIAPVVRSGGFVPGCNHGVGPQEIQTHE